MSTLRRDCFFSCLSSSLILHCFQSYEMIFSENASKKCLSASSTISSKNKPVDKSKTNSKPSNESNALLFGRDASLFLFKALGKILYCKRKYFHSSNFLLFIQYIILQLQAYKLLPTVHTIYLTTLQGR